MDTKTSAYPKIVVEQRKQEMKDLVVSFCKVVVFTFIYLLIMSTLTTIRRVFHPDMLYDHKKTWMYGRQQGNLFHGFIGPLSVPRALIATQQQLDDKDLTLFPSLSFLCGTGLGPLL